MRRNLLALCTMAAVGVLASPIFAEEAHEKLKVSDLPSDVKKAADRAVPGATWSKACKEKEDGKTVYEVTGKDATDRRVEVEVCDGSIKEVETEIGVNAVPKSYYDVFRNKYATFNPKGAEEVRRDGKIYAYDFEGKRDGKYVEIRVHTADNAVKELTEEEEAED